MEINFFKQAAPPVLNGDHVGFRLRYLRKGGLRHLKVVLGEVAPPSVVRREAVVRWAEVGGGENNGGATLQAPQYVVYTSHLEASTTCTPSVEHHAAHSRTILPVAAPMKATVPASTLCNKSPLVSCLITHY